MHILQNSLRIIVGWNVKFQYKLISIDGSAANKLKRTRLDKILVTQGRLGRGLEELLNK